MTCRKSILAALALVLSLAGPPAWGQASPPSPADLAAALGAARTQAAMSYAKTNFRQAHGVEPAAVAIADHGVAVYALNPRFVQGDAAAPAGVLQYVAVTATADTGARATLRAEPDAMGNWAVGSVFSGDDEESLSAHLRPGSVLLNEPQINGWYELTPTGVVLLRASLPQSPVGAFVPIEDYRAQVRARYGDKLPGSDYERRGGIGFAQREQSPPPVTPTRDGSALPAVLVATLLAVALLVLWWRRHGHRTSTPASDGSRSSK